MITVKHLKVSAIADDPAAAAAGEVLPSDWNADHAVVIDAIDGIPIGQTTPAAGAFTNVLLEGTGQNFFLYSEQFDNAWWSKGSTSVTANATSSPTGTLTADKLIGNVGVLARKSAYQAFTPINGPKYTFSVYLKAAERTTATIWLDSTGWAEGAYYGAGALLDLSTGVSSVPSLVSMTAVGNGWYRCVVTGTSTSNSVCNCAIAIGPANGGDYTGDGVQGIYVWGAQVELASTAGTYLATTSAAVYGIPSLSFSGVAGVSLESSGALVVKPAGAGPLQAQPTTSTTVGGNARGANAVDFQTHRYTAGAIASGPYSITVGGDGNSSTSYASSVLGGGTNTASSGFSVAVGGWNNVASGNQSAIVGGTGNQATGWYGTIPGGYANSTTANAAVTTQSATMNGTTAVTLAASNAAIKIGQYISGTNISTDTYVAAISGTSLTLSKVAAGSSTSTLSFYTPHGVVVGGGNNQATGAYSFIGGGGDAGTAGNRNVASGDWSAVVGGGKNIASGIGSFVGGGGFVGYGFAGNTASGTASTVVGGFTNTATGYASFAGGGYNNIATGAYSSVIGGQLGTTRGIDVNTVLGTNAQALGGTVGLAQSALLVLARQTTDATATVLTSNSSAAGTTNQVILPNNSAYYFKGSVIANVTGAANGAAWSFEGAIMRGANAASTVLIGTPSLSRVGASAGATAWAVALTADTTNGGLAVTVTGTASATIRWVAKVETTEVTF